MAVYTVLEPPPSGDELRDAERVQLVRDGFSWPAFLLTPLWLIWHRLWLALLLWIAVSALTQWGAAQFGEPVPLIAGLAVALLAGFEAATLRRWTLERHGWRFAGVVAGTSLDECERRYFAHRATGAAPAGDAVAAAAPVPPRAWMPPLGEDTESSRIVGLFPTAEHAR